VRFQEIAIQVQREEEQRLRYLEHKRQQKIARDEEEHRRLVRIMKELEEAELGEFRAGVHFTCVKWK
jgi:hypothetical protein